MEIIHKLEFQNRLENLKKMRGRGTTLVSFYLPSGKHIQEAINRLSNEISESQSIKSKQTRKDVQWALSASLNCAKQVNKTPENGLAIFCGVLTDGNNFSISMEPIQPLSTSIYICDSEFKLDPLFDMIAEKGSVGLLVIDRKEATIALVKGKTVSILWNKESGVQSQHRAGGWSQARFARIIEDQTHQWYQKVAGKVLQLLGESDITTLIIGGPGHTKKEFLNGYLHHEIQKIVHPNQFDVGYTNDHGIKELLDAAENSISDLALIEERKILKKFLKYVGTNDRMIEYGLEKVRNVLLIGNVDTLIIAQSNSDMDVVKELAESAQAIGSNVYFVSDETEEGRMFNTFGPYGALLRYKQ